MKWLFLLKVYKMWYDSFFLFLNGASFILKTSNNTYGKSLLFCYSVDEVLSLLFCYSVDEVLSLLFCYSVDEVLNLYTGTMYNTIAKKILVKTNILQHIFTGRLLFL
jgi:hypothetical protein